MMMNMLFSLTLLLSSIIEGYAQKTILFPGESLSLSSYLLSHNNLFQFGFRQSSQTQQTTYYYLCIWYANLTGNRHIVWAANRDLPVSHESSLSFQTSGQLMLLDPQDGASTPSTSLTAGIPGKQLLLNDSGNLVLTNDTIASGVVWQSFDHPTDTLLPTQRLLMASNLLSRNGTASDQLGSGNYKLSLITTSFRLTLSSDTTKSYWSTPEQTDFNNHYAVFHDEPSSLSFYTSNNNTVLYAAYLSWDWDEKPAIRRATLDFDGNLRIYTWNPISLLWYVTWSAVSEVCLIPNICGPYGYCVYKPQHACLCPEGLVPIDSTATWLGCTPINTTKHQCPQNHGYIILDEVNYPNNDQLMINNISLRTCQDNCSESCSCIGFIYNFAARACWLKTGKLMDGHSDLNGHTFLKSYDLTSPLSPYTEASYIRWSSMTNNSYNTTPLPATPLRAPDSGKSLVNKLATILLSTLSCILLAGYAIMLSLYLQRRSTVVPKKEPMTGCHKFTYKELGIATNYFSQKLGSGGFSTVYKGKINGSDVAVKRLEGVAQQLAEKQFLAEVMILGQIQHINLVRLIGYCTEGEHKLLVYECIEKGSLEAALFHTQLAADSVNPHELLDWKTRFQIIMGIAKALSYLHEDCLHRILHCDIKPANILLDAHFRPKVGDFGLACLYDRQHTLRLSHVRGTLGYIAPEWISSVSISDKADVYSFGMVLLEIVSGRRNFLFDHKSLDLECRSLPIWTYKLLIEGNLHEAVDNTIPESANGQFSAIEEEVERVVTVGFWCIQENINERPSMMMAIRMLEGVVNIATPPPPSSILEPIAKHESSTSNISSIS